MTASENNNKLTPIEQLKEDKRKLKIMYQQDADRLQANWDYMTDHIGIFFFNTALTSAKNIISSKKSKEQEKTPFAFLNIFKSTSGTSALNMLSASLPVLWEIAQPMLIGLLVRRVKKIFTSKKKKKE